jgi:polyhydroxybutyrate depolymerase
MSRSCIVLVVLFLVLGCLATPASAEDRNIAGRAQRKTLLSGGREREYLLFVPPHAARLPLPLLLVLHGGSMTAGQAERTTGFTKLAAAEHFIVAYPQAVKRHWNDGRGGAPQAAVDDVGFLRDLVAEIRAKYGVDERRIYAAGPSNGGMMTLRLGCEAGDLFAGIAAVIASLPEAELPRCRDQGPLTLVMINGTADRLVPYQGGAVHAFGREAGTVLPVERTFELFVRRNRCELPAEETILKSLAENDPTQVRRRSYAHCAGQTTSTLYTVSGGGHRWPGVEPLKGLKGRLGDLLGRRTQILDASGLIWEKLSNTRK